MVVSRSTKLAFIGCLVLSPIPLAFVGKLLYKVALRMTGEDVVAFIATIYQLAFLYMAAIYFVGTMEVRK
jgi:hypothetical protein